MNITNNSTAMRFTINPGIMYMDGSSSVVALNCFYFISSKDCHNSHVCAVIVLTRCLIHLCLQFSAAKKVQRHSRVESIRRSARRVQLCLCKIKEEEPYISSCHKFRYIHLELLSAIDHIISSVWMMDFRSVKFWCWCNWKLLIYNNDNNDIITRILNAATGEGMNLDVLDYKSPIYCPQGK